MFFGGEKQKYAMLFYFLIVESGISDPLLYPYCPRLHSTFDFAIPFLVELWWLGT